MFGRTAAWNSASNDEERVRSGFWEKVRRVGRKLPFAEDLLAAYYCAFDRKTPMRVKAALMGALAYFVLPADFMPDIMPLLGYGDDAVILLTALRMVSSHVSDEHREAARQALARGLDDPR